MTQDELAKILNTSKQVISRYENALRSPKISVVRDFSKKLNVPISYFIEEDTPEEIPGQVGNISTGDSSKDKNPSPVDDDKIILSKRDTDPELLQIIDIFGKINGAGQHQLLLYANFLYTSDEYQPAQPIRRSMAAYGGGVKELPPLDPDEE